MIEDKTWSPVVYYLENDMDTLDTKLHTFEDDLLRKIISYQHMDPTGRFRRWSTDQLIEHIKKMAYSRAHKGDVFRTM